MMCMTLCLEAQVRRSATDCGLHRETEQLRAGQTRGEAELTAGFREWVHKRSLENPSQFSVCLKIFILTRYNQWSWDNAPSNVYKYQ